MIAKGKGIQIGCPICAVPDDHRRKPKLSHEHIHHNPRSSPIPVRKWVYVREPSMYDCGVKYSWHVVLLGVNPVDKLGHEARYFRVIWRTVG
ncbi:hypothetical protein MM1218R_01545 [Mycobacterium marinum]|nr:hypothetical protein MM1218R_01545 [Mycobacterium marinum]RFZ11455.1 hypothetical protein DE4381_01043 [Mycobacterium marinum]